MKREFLSEGGPDALKILDDNLDAIFQRSEIPLKKLESYCDIFWQKRNKLRDGELLEVENDVFFLAQKELLKEETRPWVIPTAWHNYFYPLISVSVYWGRPKPYRIYLPLKLEEPRKILFCIYSETSKRQNTAEVDFKGLPDAYWKEVIKWSEKHGFTKRHYNDWSPIEKTLEALDEAKFYCECFLKYRDAKHLISHQLTYIGRLEAEFRYAVIDFEQKKPIGDELRSLPDALRERLDVPVSCLYRRIKEQLAAAPEDCMNDWFHTAKALMELRVQNYKNWYNYFFRLCIWSSDKMREGINYPTLSFDKIFRLDYLPLNLESLGTKAVEYYSNVSFDFPWHFKETIGDANIQVDKDTFEANFPSIQTTPAEAREFIQDTLREAFSLKDWIIPLGAYLQLYGSLAGLKLFEIDKRVYCVFVFKNGRYFRLEILMEDTIRIRVMSDPFEVGFAGKDRFYSASNLESLEDPKLLGGLLLASAAIRDFWVVEEREAVFGKGVSTRKVSQLIGDHRKPVIVYLPRILYKNISTGIPEAREQLNYAVRREHFVRGHFRKAVKASPRQILLAQQAGVYIPDGKTWVSGHKRGDQAAERIYRSRSVLRCLRVIDDAAKGRDAWFGFEKNVRDWLTSFGFQTTHKSASRNGDGGIDVQASKGSEHLYIQCKFWKENVGINTVREMMGTLQTFPEGSQGVIVTSSELTVPARELAMQFKIQFVENVNFDHPIDKDLKKTDKKK